MKKYHGLELEAIKEIVKGYASFSLGKEKVESLTVNFSPLMIKLENNRSKEALFTTRKYGSMPFYGIKDITTALNKASKDGILNVFELYSVYDHIQGVKGILSYVKNVEEELIYIQDLTDTLVYDNNIANSIEKCFSPYGDILDKASSTLFKIRNDLKKVDSEIVSSTARFLKEHQTSMQDNIVSSRNNRACLLIKNTDKNSFGGFIHGDSASKLASYVEPEFLIPLNNKKQSLLYEESVEIERILYENSQLVKTKAANFLQNLETLALLDSIYAKAIFGQKYDCCIPNLNNESKLILNDARHPLIDQKKVVKNSYKIVSPYKCLLITGPNTGGKTVSLKIIGLFTLMCYLGIPLPMEDGTIPFFDEVYEDITDDQSIVESLSTFSSHLKKLATITKYATSKSLVLLDEIGNGTDPREGEALAIAVLDDLRSKGCMQVVTTHLGKLKSYGKKYDDILIASVQFDTNHLLPTYKFIEGLTGQSNALEIASRFGLSQTIIDEAYKIKQSSKSTEDELIEKLEKQLIDNQLIQESLLEKERELDELKQKLINEKQFFEDNKHKLMEKAKDEANEYILKIKSEAEEIIDDLMNKQNDIKYHETLIVKKQLDNLIKEETEEIFNEDKEFKVNDYVEITKSKQVGQIISINRKNVVINLNGIKINTKTDQIRHTNRKVEKNKVVKSTKVKSTSSNFNMECNLIGMHVDEALQVTSKYLDTARLNKVKTVRLIHGVGTGALRKAIHEYLNRSKYVESYRLGAIGEGGVGATVVVLK